MEKGSNLPFCSRLLHIVAAFHMFDGMRNRITHTKFDGKRKQPGLLGPLGKLRVAYKSLAYDAKGISSHFEHSALQSMLS
jgi:hypothetical protein